MIEPYYNVRVINCAIWPAEVFLHSRLPLNSVEDIKGLKIRLIGDEVEMFRRMGANPILIGSGEAYEALQTGAINAAQYSTPFNNFSNSIQEVCDYMYLSPVRQPMSGEFIIVNKGSWAELPPDLQGLMQAVIESEVIRSYGRAIVKDLDAIGNFQAYGTTVEPAPKDIEDALIFEAERFYAEKAAQDAFYAEVLNSQRAWQSSIRGMLERL